jgi:hypothetical protein
MLHSCKKDDAVNSGKTELISFGPTGARHGDTIRFIGNNLNTITAIQFTGTGATVEKAAFIQQTSSLITVKVPVEAEQGFVTLKSGQTDIVSKTRFNLEVMPVIGTMTAEARPGENITITGQHLNWVTRVTFANDKHVDTFVSRSINQLVVKVPETARSGRLVIAYSGTKPETMQSRDTFKVTLPVITALAPNPIKHADNITITGTNLDLVRKVYFSGSATAVTSFVSQSATQLVVRVPGTATKGRVVLEAPSGVTTMSASDLEIVMPTMSSMAPNPVAIGSNLTIMGTNLDVVSSVAFTGVPAAVATFVSQTATQLVVRVPTGALTGRITLNIRNSNLMVVSTSDLQIAGSSVAPIIVYDNALSSNWEKWGGWGTTAQDLDNTERPQSGTTAIKVTYSDAYGALQLHPRTTFAFPPAGYTKLKISVYGGAGTTATSRLALYMKDATDPTEAQKRPIAIVPGAYTTFEINLSDFSNNPARVNEFVIQNYGTANATFYIDDISFQ